ncbi:MAG: hypothetical protein KDD94_03805 [Calditrichaeota bacterium]|nr:hypothetical protein [Calditrichota bacterium]
MLNWTLEKIRLDLKFDWAISRSTSQYKINFIVHVSDGTISASGEIAPNIRYGENTEVIETQFNQIQNQLSKISSTQEILDLCSQHKIKHSLSFGLESALVHLICKRDQIAITNYFGIESVKSVFTSFSLPIMPADEISQFIKSIDRFRYLKIKVNADNALETVRTVRQFSEKPLRIDANESFQSASDVIDFIDELDDQGIEFLEQPMPANLNTEYYKLKASNKIELIADESIESECDFMDISKQFHGINVKLMKAGSYTNAVSLLKQARKFHLKTMIGCMIETSLGISSALNLGALADYVDLDGFLIIRDDPFYLVDEMAGELSLRQSAH